MLRTSFIVPSFFALCASAQIDPEWAVRYVAEDSMFVHNCTDMEVDALGNILVAGFLGEPAPAGRVVLLKYSPAGLLEWERSINVVATDAQLEVDPSGAIFLMYTYHDDISNLDFVYTKFSSQGDSLLTGRFTTSNAPSMEWANSIFLDDQGLLHMTGEHSYVDIGAGDQFEILTVVFDPSGQPAWHAFHNAGTHGVERGLAVGADSEGSTYVSAVSVDGADSNLVVLKYDISGTLIWQRRRKALQGSFARSLEVADQRVIVGSTVSSPMDILCQGFSFDGDSIFDARFTAPWDWNAPDHISDMTVDPNGYVYITGTACPGSGESDDYLALKLDPQGEVLWHWRYNGGVGWDDAKAVDHGPFGELYAFGESRDSILQTTLLLTVKLGSNGQPLWMGKYTGTSAWSYRAVAAKCSPDGSFFGAGTEYRPNGTENFILLKYGPTVGLEEHSASQLLIHPNPSSGPVVVVLPEIGEPMHLQACNAMGQIIMSWQIPSGGSHSFDTDDFASGSYILTAHGDSYTGRVRFIIAK